MKIERKIIFRLMLILPFLFGTLAINAQSDHTGKSAATRTYAITNASIVQSPGSVMEGGTIVVKNGLISAVGKNVSIPDDAQVLDGTGMYVYAGFIDGMSNVGTKRPKSMERPSNLFTPDPPNDYAGITPERHVVDQIDVASSTIGDMRKAGFTIAHTVPYGRMLPGSGALIFLADRDHPDDIILAENVAMFSQFVGAPGAYPGNILGIMAKWRNIYTNADYSMKHTMMYSENPSGLERPNRDRTLEAFFPVVAGQKPVYFNVQNMLDVRRALRLQNDLGFNIAVANVKQGWELADELKQKGAKVYLSMDLPDEPKPSKSEDKTEEVKQLEARKMEFYKKYVSQAATYQAAGVQFGFSTMGTRGNKVKTHMMTMIENGLSADDALAALTTSPASLLGIDKVAGTAEVGKLGNLVVTTGPYFEKKSQVKYVFVDGDKYDYEIKEDKKKDGKATDDASAETSNDPIVGTWTWTMTTPGGDQEGKMIIKLEDGKYTGLLTSDDGSPDNDLENVNFREGTLSFEFAIDAGGQSAEVVVTGSISGSNYEASASVAAFNVTLEFSASKDDGR
jgi:Amidohydrolase family